MEDVRRKGCRQMQFVQIGVSVFQIGTVLRKNEKLSELAVEM